MQRGSYEIQYFFFKGHSKLTYIFYVIKKHPGKI